MAVMTSTSPTVLAVANQKGGVAKTTTVASIGAALAELGHKVLLVDLDPQACLTFSLGIEVDEQHLVAELGERGTDRGDGRRLGDATLLVGDREDGRGSAGHPRHCAGRAPA